MGGEFRFRRIGEAYANIRASQPMRGDGRLGLYLVGSGVQQVPLFN
jgi:hypothetical protein